MADDMDTDLPRWAGITEPMTVLTNIVLSAVAFVLTVRLGYLASAEGLKAAGAMAGALMATALSAILGAVSHGTDPRIDPELRLRLWRGALHVMGLIGLATIMSVAFFAARGATRTAILIFAALKLVWFTIAVARRPEFRVAVADSGASLAILLAGATYAAVRWSEPGASWLIGGVLVSLGAALTQARRVALHRHFNHNDLFHVIQMVALYMFYRGGALLVDR